MLFPGGVSRSRRLSAAVVHYASSCRRTSFTAAPIFSPRPCPACHKPFTSDRALRAHTAHHSKPFACAYCPTRFVSRSNWSLHQKEKHAHLFGHRQFRASCPACHIEFFRPHQLAEHLATTSATHSRSTNPELIDVRACDLTTDNVFFGSEPLIGQQYLEHCTTLAKKEHIERSQCIRGDLFEPSYELVGLLAHSRAPRAVLFTLTSASDLTIPRIADYPPDSEAGELGAKLLLPLSATIQPRLAAVPDTDSNASPGELRMFFCGLTLPGRFFARAKLPLRAIVVFAHKDRAHELVEVGAVEMNPFDNAILRLDRRANSWKVATRVKFDEVYRRPEKLDDHGHAEMVTNPEHADTPVDSEHAHAAGNSEYARMVTSSEHADTVTGNFDEGITHGLTSSRDRTLTDEERAASTEPLRQTASQAQSSSDRSKVSATKKSVSQASRRLKVHVGVVDALDFRECDHEWLDVAQKLVLNQHTFCPICDQKFAGRLVHDHFAVAHEGKRFSCSSCDSTFATRAGLDEHFASAHRSHRLQCDRCDATFVYARSLREHRMNVQCW